MMRFPPRAALALSLAFAAAPAAADGIVDNVNGITVERDGRVIRFRAMLVDGAGHVARLIPPGEAPPKLSRRELKKNAGKPLYDWRVDMGGRTLIPGFVDAHGHLMELGLRAGMLDLSAARSLAEAQAAIRAYAAANPERSWILGGGWDQERWGTARLPAVGDLDAAVADRPVWLARADGHAHWANAAALKAAGVTAATTSPLGGRIEGGVFVDAAQALVERAVPQPLPKERDGALLTAQATLLARGITATADMGTSVDDWLSFRRMGDLGALRVRIMSYGLGIDTASRIGGKGPTPWLYDDRLRMGGVKLFADGALGSRGAWLKAPYSDAPGQRGAGSYSDAQLQNLMSRAAMDRFQVAVHAIGDRANAQALDAIEVLSETYTGDRRWRIEHAQVVDPADLPRFARHGIVASMQPVHATDDRLMAAARLGEARLAGAYAWRTMLANGVPLAFGSDYPFPAPDPFGGWAAAFTRQDAAGAPAGGWHPEQAVTREQAWWSWTGGGAYAGLADDRFGSLRAGQGADFIIVDRDPLAVDAAALRATRVLETWIGGKKAWSATPPR